jgi:hypothetical protein
MKVSNIISASALAAIIFFISASITYAQWDALNSGYAVTTDYHGKEVPPGTLVTATAGTTDGKVTNVTFIWKYPNKTVAYEVNKEVWYNGSTYDGKLIHYANSSYTPDTLGDWGVQALFIGEGGTTKANHEDVIKIRATSFNVTPDFPVVGVAGALGVMLLSLRIFMRRKIKVTR